MYLKPNNIEFFSFIEGQRIKQRGGLFMSILVPQQMLSRQLSADEVIAIYRQAVKDPSILSKNCQFGKKAHLITYHAQQILGIQDYLVPEQDSPDVAIGVIGGPLSYIAVTISYPTKHIVYVSHELQNISIDDIVITNTYRWFR